MGAKISIRQMIDDYYDDKGKDLMLNELDSLGYISRPASGDYTRDTLLEAAVSDGFIEPDEKWEFSDKERKKFGRGIEEKLASVMDVEVDSSDWHIEYASITDKYGHVDSLGTTGFIDMSNPEIKALEKGEYDVIDEIVNRSRDTLLLYKGSETDFDKIQLPDMPAESREIFKNAFDKTMELKQSKDAPIANARMGRNVSHSPDVSSDIDIAPEAALADKSIAD